MRRTLLVQRLVKPSEIVNAFSFGGGLINGGLSDDAFDLMKGLWSFDYMGASEFEWGAVPAALMEIARYSDSGNAQTGALSLAKDVHYLCRDEDEAGVIATIEDLAINEYKNMPLKEYCHLQANLEGEDFAQNYAGWLELDNAFMFFVDREMYDNSLKLFGINSGE